MKAFLTPNPLPTPVQQTVDQVLANNLAKTAMNSAEARYGKFPDAELVKESIAGIAELLKGRAQNASDRIIADFHNLNDKLMLALEQSAFKQDQQLIALVPHLGIEFLKLANSEVGKRYNSSLYPEFLKEFLTECQSGPQESRVIAGSLLVKVQILRDGNTAADSSALAQLAPVTPKPELAKPTAQIKVVPAVGSSIAEKIAFHCLDRARNTGLLEKALDNNPLKQIFKWKIDQGKSSATVGVKVSFKGSKDLEALLNPNYGFSRKHEIDPLENKPGWRNMNAYGSNHAIAGSLIQSAEVRTALRGLVNKGDLLGAIAYKFIPADYKSKGIFAPISSSFIKISTEFFEGGPRENLSIVFMPPKSLENISEQHTRLDPKDLLVQLDINLLTKDADKLRALIATHGADAVFYDFLRKDNETQTIGETVIQWLRAGLFAPLLSEVKNADNLYDRGAIWGESKESHKQTCFSNYVVCDISSDVSKSNFIAAQNRAREDILE